MADNINIQIKVRVDTAVNETGKCSQQMAVNLHTQIKVLQSWTRILNSIWTS